MNRYTTLAVALLSAGVSMPALAQSSASAFTSATRFDAERQLTGTIAPDPDGTGPLRHAATRNTYDAAGWHTRVETGELAAWQAESVAPSAWSGFAVHRVLDTSYDALGRKLTERTSSGGTTHTLTQYTYDNVGRLECTAVRMNPAAFASPPASACTLGPEGSHGPDRITRQVHDAAGQVLKEQRAYGTPLQQDYASYSWSDNGKRTSVVDANGNRAEMRYDGHDRQDRWTFPSKTTPGQVNAADYEEYGYDANGNRTSLRKRDARTLLFGHDKLNRMTLKDIPGGTASDVHYGYDLRGLQLHARFGSATGEGVTNSYTGFGELAASTTNMGGVARTLTHQYDANGNRVAITHPDAKVFTYSHDGLDRMLQTFDNGGAGQLDLFAYDPQGRMKSHFGGAITYGYDGAGRLASLGFLDLSNTGRALTTGLAYNPASQVTTRTRSNDVYAHAGYANASAGYAVNGLNQYTSVAGAALTHDANGNLISQGSTTYAYDVENRLIGASGGVTLGYDPLGRLWQVTGPGGTTRFLYDGDQLTAEYDGSGVMTRRYVHGTGEDDPIIAYEGAGIGAAERRHLFADHQGSIVGLLHGTNAAMSVNTYDEYGVPAAANQGRFQYTGQAWIPEIGMYHYKARVYNPRLGRFMQTDPIGYDDQVNLYAYVGNDPVSHVDPTGKNKVKWFVETVKGAWKHVTEKQAQSSRLAEKNIRSEGPGQVGRGKRLEEKVQGSKDAVTKHKPHSNGKPEHRGTTETHFQPSNRKTGGEGHTFVGPPAAGAALAVGLAGAMRDVADSIGTASDNLNDNSSNLERNAATVWDFFDPASNIADTLRVGADLINPEME